MPRLSHVLSGLALVATSVPSLAEELTLEQRLAAAEERLASLETRKSEAPKVAINGFITFAMEKSSLVEDAAGNDLSYLGSVDNEGWNLNRLTRAGLQFNSKISDKAEAVVQLLGRASDDFNVDVQWAYVGYDLTPGLTARAGRFVLPFYLHSQYTQVGYAYPWIELPSEQYSVIPLDTMEGIDLTWQTRTGNISHSINVFWGGMQVDDTTNGTTFDVQNQHGINVRSEWGNWSGWYSFSNSEVTLDLSTVPPGLFTSLSMDKRYAYFTGLGVQYDNGSLFAMAERGRLNLSTPFDWFPQTDSGYVTVGYRHGKWTPHLTWAMIDHGDTSEVDASGVPIPPANVDASFVLFSSYAQRQKSWTLGTRYDLTPGVALKAEATHMYDFGDDDFRTQGLFSGAVGSGTPDKGEPWVYRLAVESVF